ncbi:MAG: hypothetical protein ABIN67_17215 [Ferruginibacter sp.]
MKRSILFAGILTMLSISSKAQEYKTAVGIRLGPTSPAIAPGFTIKHFLNENHAVEGLMSVGNGFGLCGLYEWHHPIASVEHLQWFAGAGAYLAFRSSETFVGAAGIVGLDYKFAEIPLNISVDWKPELNLVSEVGYEGAGVGVSARFTF